MKYKNIPAAIHNLGDSFLSSLNYVDDGYVDDDIRRIHGRGHEITIDWLNMTFAPEAEATPRIVKSLGSYHAGLAAHFAGLNVDLARLAAVNFRWPLDARKFMEATDDRGKYHKIYVREIK